MRMMSAAWCVVYDGKHQMDTLRLKLLISSRLVTVAQTLENGLALCRLHHWAVDHGWLAIEMSSVFSSVMPRRKTGIQSSKSMLVIRFTFQTTRTHSRRFRFSGLTA